MARRRWQTWAGLSVAAMTVVATVQIVEAAPGDLDGSFGSGGLVTSTVGLPEDVLDTGGRVLAVSSASTGPLTWDLHVRAFTATGSPDTTFSGDGAVTLSVDGSIGTASVAVDAQARVVVAAGVATGPGSGTRIWRFEPDGDLDPTFSGDGVQSIGPGAGFAQVMGLGFQPDGDVLVGVNDTFIVGGLSQLPQIVRLTEAGTVVQTVDVLPDYTERGSLATLEVDATGRPYVLVPDDGKLTVRRYTTSIALDTSYSGDGRVDVARPGGSGDNDNWGGAIHVAGDGVVLVAGTVGSFTQTGPNPPVIVEQATLAARLTPAGALDTSFSGDGIAALARPSGSISPEGIGPSASGGAVVAAWRELGGGAETTGVVWQLTAAGAAETGFSGDGRLERSAWLVEATVSATAARLYLYEVGPSQSNGRLAAISLAVPAAPTVPGAPTAVTVTAASATTATVRFTMPATTGGSAITGSKVLVYEGTGASPVQTVSQVGTATSVAVTGLAAGKLHRFRAVVTNAIGDSAPSAFSPYALTPFTTVDRFVRQLHSDLRSKAPTTAELNDLRGRLQSGATSPTAAVVEISAKPEWTTLDPLTRIYYAYFGRTPDTGGAKYWLGRRRAGISVSRISDQFVASSEFRNTYGSLSNGAFVDLVYQNVLGRAPDAAGRTYWVRRLNDRKVSRGQVMVSFSESNEHKNRRAGEVNTVSVFLGLLARVPTGAEMTTWRPQVTSTKTVLVESLLASADYDARIPAS